MILDSIAEARALGARLGPCCKLVGIDVRTVQRWLKFGPEGGKDRRRGPNAAPANTLTEAERERILEVVSAPEFRDLPVSQIVPMLADMGIYVASESTIYRLLRSRKMAAHRGRKRPPRKRRPKEHRPRAHARYGRGTSRTCVRRYADSSTTCTCSWTFGAGWSSVGPFMTEKTMNFRERSSWTSARPVVLIRRAWLSTRTTAQQ